MRFIVLVGFILLFSSCYAQESEREKLQQREMQKEFEQNRKVRMQMDSGIYYCDHEEYELADAKFRYALSNLKSVPSDLVFYFGKNSYLMGKFKQSVDWLTKYIQLKGTTGTFSAEAAGWLKKAEKGLLEQRQSESLKAAEVFSRDYNIDCGPSGMVTCPVCNGATVIIKKDYLGETYKTCPYCDKHGLLSCEDYNKLLRGQLKPSK